MQFDFRLCGLKEAQGDFHENFKESFLTSLQALRAPRQLAGV